MQIRRILVPLFGGGNDGLGLDLGFDLAQEFTAHVEAMFVHPDSESAVPYLGFEHGDEDCARSSGLLAATSEAEASLLVMGGYAHSRIEEAVFEGTTLDAMRHADLPLLLMH